MHKSLSVGTNRLLIVSWAAGVLTIVLLTRGAVSVSVVVGAICGAVAGLLQRDALRSNAVAFANTVTALDVRRALTSSLAGKVAICFGWIGGLLLLLVAILLHEKTRAISSWLAGYLAFMLLRDTIAYRALRYVSAASSGA